MFYRQHQITSSTVGDFIWTKDTWMHLSLNGNGLLAIFKGALPVEEEKYEISFRDHVTNKMTRLGYFPIFYLTHNGNYVVLLGPLEYTQAPFTLRAIFGTARIKLVPAYHFFGSWTTYLGSPRIKKVVRYQKSSVV